MMRAGFLMAILGLAFMPAAQAQFSSGSTGSDGALNLTTPGTVIFDPVTMNLDPAGDNVFNFTTINIAQGTTVVLTAGKLRNKPVIWLASGAITIAGNLNLQGADGATMTAANPGEARFPAMPGPGGFPGGVGGYLTSPATAGGGYGGGVAGVVNSNPFYEQGQNGVYSYYNNLALVPLVGGTGGGGGLLVSGAIAGGNGGAGGGAIRIVSSVSISVTGTINAYGGNSGLGAGNGATYGGQGSGGAIHLIAPTVSGNGFFWVENPNAQAGGTVGVVKISATSNQYTGQSTEGLVTGPLYNPPLPAGAPAVQVVSVNGVAAPAAVTGSLLAPDFTISANTPVTVNIAAQNIPVGAVVQLHLSSEQGNDSVVTCAALAGTIASSTATCTGASFPQGITLTDIKATW
jgi:hypothetical protein